MKDLWEPLAMFTVIMAYSVVMVGLLFGIVWVVWRKIMRKY